MTPLDVPRTDTSHEILYAASLLPSLTSFCRVVSESGRVSWKGESTYKSPHGAVKSMSVVAAELRVGTLERRVSVGLWLLDTVLPLHQLLFRWSMSVVELRVDCMRCSLSTKALDRIIPVLVRLLGLVVLGRVLGL